MYSVTSGTTRGLADTTHFIELLNGLPESATVELREFFETGGELVVTRAPGRLDLMGGIADYSGSLVLEWPIAAATHAALQLRRERSIRVASLAGGGRERPRLFEIALDELTDSGRPLDYPAAAEYFKSVPGQHWAAYVAGAFLVLMRERGCVFDKGARILINSDVPEGKGVSSSAALEVATMQAITAGYGIDTSPRELAFLCQKVENLVACAPCGLMDQMTSACGEQDRLLALLCQPGEMKGTVSLPEGLAAWGIDSGIRHSVGGADYGTVRTAAFMGYRMVAGMAGLACREADVEGCVLVDDPKWGGYLANITPEEFEGSFASRLPVRMSGAEFLEQYGGITDPVMSVNADRWYPVRQAARHPVYEHDRVKKFAEILNDWRGLAQARRLGELMYQSHESYSDCGLGTSGTDEIVRLVREAGEATGLYGAKVTGGGSGGTVAVLGGSDAGASVVAVVEEYGRRTGHESLVISGSSPGAAAFGHLKLSGKS